MRLQEVFTKVSAKFTNKTVEIVEYASRKTNRQFHRIVQLKLKIHIVYPSGGGAGWEIYIRTKRNLENPPRLEVVLIPETLLLFLAIYVFYGYTKMGKIIAKEIP